MYQSFLNWSSGKDSALALYYALQQGSYSVQCLLTNITGENGDVAMHGISEVLVHAQAAAIGLPLHKVVMPEMPAMEVYEQTTTAALQDLKEQGYTHSLYGDIFLEDLREYRQQQMARAGMTAVFPLWKKDTRLLLQEFIELGFKAIVVCVKQDKLDQQWVGRIIDPSFLNELPVGVDPCGENGEFHTFVFDGPVFRYPVQFTMGEHYVKHYPTPQVGKQQTALVNPAMDTFHYCTLFAG